MYRKGEFNTCLKKVYTVVRGPIRIASVTAFLSFFLFFWKEISFVQYLGVALSLFVFFLFSYCYFKSKRFFPVYGLVASVNLAIFLFQKYLKGFWICFDTIDIIYSIYASWVLVFLLIGVLKWFRDWRRNSAALASEEQDEEVNLFTERRYDLKRIFSYLKQYNAIGVAAKWGDGKTFLFKILEKKLKVHYYFAKIGVMSVTVDTAEKIILDEINHLLEREGIFSSASTKLKNILSSQSVLNAVCSLFFDSNSYASQINVLKEDVKKLSKPVVLVFEDIDRIADEKIIYKIFSIAESLSSNRIKVVYQYNEDDLINILKKDKLYLEKYIPYTVNITPLDFGHVVAAFCDAKKYVNIKKDDFMFLRLFKNVPNIIKNRVQIGDRIQLQIPSFSIRKVIIFLDEIESSLNNDAYKTKNEIKETVILYYVIKHFMYNLYDKISLQRNFLNEYLFESEDERYSLRDILKANVDRNFFADNPDNKQALAILIMLGYDFKPIVDSLDETEVRGKRSIKEFFKNVEEEEKNEKISRVIRNLYAQGLSEFTNYENAVKEMKKMVLSAPLNMQNDQYVVLSDRMFHRAFDRDNGTIFRIGIPKELEIFRAFNLCENDSSIWIKLIDFYFRNKNIKDITSDLIDILLLCRIEERDVYLYILKKFNALRVVGNLLDIESYKDFLMKYLEAFSGLSYVDTHILGLLESHPKTYNSHVPKVLDSLCNVLKKMQQQIPIDAMKKDLGTMIKFLEKNKMIVNHPTILPESQYNGFDIKIDESSPRSDTLFKKLKKASRVKRLRIIKDAYNSKKYGPAEIMDVWKKLQEEK